MRFWIPAALVFACVACERPTPKERPDPLPVLPMAVISTTSGEIVERWQAPDLLFDVAVDHQTGRVWGIAESEEELGPGSTGATLVELHPTGEPTVHFELPIPDVDFVWLIVGMFNYWDDVGHLKLDPIRRRGVVTAPSSTAHVVFDLDSGEIVDRLFSNTYEHSSVFDEEQGIGFTSGAAVVASFVTSSGQLVNGDVCPSIPEYSKWALAYSKDSRQLFSSHHKIGLLGDIPARVLTCDVDTGAFSVEVIDCDDLVCLPIGMAVNSTGGRLYIALNRQGPAFQIWDLSGTSRITVDSDSAPHGFALSPDDTTLFVTNDGCNRISVYDAVVGEHLYDAPTDGFTLGIDLSADGSRLFVAQGREDGFIGHWGAAGPESQLPCPPLLPKE